ncbi:MAG: RNA polymerase factor sigma-54 [Muribaculaceae bacterium]|nr:RNA polymerase factor sigma-54 [Muribaculaceae bacterium]
MASNQNLSLEQKTVMRLSMQQLRFTKLLEYTAPELEEAIDRELEENPALEIDEDQPIEQEESPQYRFYQGRNQSGEEQNYDFSPPDTGESLLDSLLRQLSERTMPDLTRTTARYIIGNIDSNGYLRRPIDGIINDMAFGPGINVDKATALEALDIVRDFEPYGVGAGDLRECLRLQLLHLPKNEATEDALNIIDNQFEAFSMKHSHKLTSSLKLSPQRVKVAVDLIRSLNPKPGAAFSSSMDTSNVIVPDLNVNVEDGEISISTNNRIPELTIDRTFSEAVAELNANAQKKAKKGNEFIFNRYNDARDFIRILKQRQETLINVMTAIVTIQKEYFLTQNIYRLKPMMIKDISAMTGYDLSVVSRATTNKHVNTPWGIFPLRFFFSDSIGGEKGGEKDRETGETESEVLTNRKIEAEIKKIVEEEDKKHPLSDEKIKDAMLKKGYDVSRRTIAKYRDRTGIPVARLRRDM